MRPQFSAFMLLALTGCDKKPAPVEKDPEPPARASLSPLRSEPDWKSFEDCQSVLTLQEFDKAYRGVYADNGAPSPSIRVEEDRVFVEKTSGLGDWMEILFRQEDEPGKAPSRYWRTAGEMPSMDGRSPLKGVKLAIDPGHIGGPWAQMEERCLAAPGCPIVMEGELTLQTAKKLATKLRELGAMVSLVREQTEPVTPLRPANLKKIARWILQQQGVQNPGDSYEGLNGAAKLTTVEWMAERLFYRTAEIEERARIVNDIIKPDLVLCLHFDAAACGNATSPIFSDENHFHLLVNGCYSSGELGMDDIRASMLRRLFTGVQKEEIALANTVGTEFAAVCKLPPRNYSGLAAKKVNANAFVWARNLQANREYMAPVVYFEPYVMNNETVIQRIAAGDYEGAKEVAGELRPSIFAEYVDGVVAGLTKYYQENRRP